jgi:hypothetical protein
MSGGQRARILDDGAIHPAPVTFERDQALAAQMRRQVFDPMEAADSTLVACHSPVPGFGRLVRLQGRCYWQGLCSATIDAPFQSDYARTLHLPEDTPMMGRPFGLIVILAFSLLWAPLGAEAQPSAKVYGIGRLHAGIDHVPPFSG